MNTPHPQNLTWPARINRLTTLSKDETGCIKGVAILIMLAHHLYGMYGVEVDAGLAYPDSVKEWARYGKVCVCMFAFVTGYGFYFVAQKDGRNPVMAAFHRLRGFYPLFLALLMLRTGIAALDPACISEPFEGWGGALEVFVYSALGITCYFPDYWYISLFILACLVYYPLFLWGSRHGKIAAGGVLVLLALLSVCAEWLWNRLFGSIYVKTPSSVVSAIQQGAFKEACPFMVYVVIGLAVACLARAENIPGMVAPVCVLVLAAIVCGVHFWLLAVGVAIAVWLAGTKAGGLMRRLGVLSAVMWLTHRLFFGYWLADFFYRGLLISGC